METGPAPPASDCKFLQAAARQPGEGAAAPGRAGGAAAAPRPHLKEKRARKRRWWRRSGGRRKKRKRSEERRRKEEEKGEEKETEPERRRKRERGRKRQKGRVSGAAFLLPFLRSLARSGSARSPAGALCGRSWKLGGILRSCPAAADSTARLGEGGGSPPSAAPGAPASKRSPPRSSRRRVGRRRQHRGPPAREPPSAPRTPAPRRAPEGRPLPLPPSGARGPGARFRPPGAARPAPPPGRRAAGGSSMGSGRVPGLCLLVLLVQARAAQHSKAAQGKEGGARGRGAAESAGPEGGDEISKGQGRCWEACFCQDPHSAPHSRAGDLPSGRWKSQRWHG